ncbi:uncharacterized protein LOC135332284 isoform X4 [Halichondria panicea]|uniref:uncharacterized protein LOC135332284 isoform X4 n=1 Tax=Halichondria panicea TaxID=6063 RepID=UPI00312B9C87
MAEGGKGEELPDYGEDWTHIESSDAEKLKLLLPPMNYSVFNKDGVNIDFVEPVANTADTNLEVSDDPAAADTSLEVSDDPTDSANLLSTSTDELAASLPSKDLPASNNQTETTSTFDKDASKGPTMLLQGNEKPTECIIQGHEDCTVTTQDYVQPPTLFEVSSEGGTCSLKDLNVTIKIPQGAVPPGVKAYFRVAVCLGSGQSVYPAGAIPISAVFLLQMTNGVELQEPVRISLPHFLSDPAKVGEMGVMKAPHDESGPPKFIEQPCKVTPVDGHEIATFSIQHFCYLQLYTKAKSEEALEFRYCICPVLPLFSNMPLGTPFFMYFCLTYFDPTFLMALDSQCETVPRLKNHRVDKDRIIQFTASHSLRVSTVKYKVNKPQRNSGWQWDVSYTALDMPLHPSEHTDNGFKYLFNSFLYPPSYKLEVCGSGSKTNTDMVVVTFRDCSGKKIEIAVPLPSYTPGPKEPEKLSPEYIVFKLCSTKLIQIIKIVAVTFGDALWSADLIPSDVLDCTREMTHAVEKAQKLVYTIRDSIEHRPSKYHDFVKVLKDNNESWAINALSTLDKCYSDLKGKYISEVLEHHRTTLIVEINPILGRVINRLWRLCIVRVPDSRKSAQDVITILGDELKCKPWLFKNACIALGIGGLKKDTIKTIQVTVCKRFPKALKETQVLDGSGGRRELMVENTPKRTLTMP